jgi:large subunit ribosomal protein L21
MYAIIETGGKQYRVELGTELEVERLSGDPGSEIVLDQVLLVADGENASVGRPLVAGAEVRASVVRQDRGDKIVVFKYKSKTRHRVKRGHRQELTVLRIADILHDGRSAAKAAVAEAKEGEAEREKAAREAASQAARDVAVAAELAAKTTEAKAEAERERKAEAKAKADARAGAKARPEPKTKAAAAPKPKAEAKPKAEVKPKAETKTKAEAKATTDAKPKTATTKDRTASKAAPAKKTDNTKPAGRAKKEP